jgi:hypothetical protein
MGIVRLATSDRTEMFGRARRDSVWLVRERATAAPRDAGVRRGGHPMPAR